MKSYKVEDSHLLKLPKVIISKPPKSTFVDRNRHPDMRRNLGNFDYEEPIENKDIPKMKILK